MKIKMLTDLRAYDFNLIKDKEYEVTYFDNEVIYVLDENEITVGIDIKCQDINFIFLNDDEDINE